MNFIIKTTIGETETISEQNVREAFCTKKGECFVRWFSDLTNETKTCKVVRGTYDEIIHSFFSSL